MKLNKSILMMATAAVFGLASCSEDIDFKNYNSSAEGKQQQYSFAQGEQSFSYLPSDEVVEQVKFTLSRTNAAAQESLKVVVDDESTGAFAFADEAFADKDTIDVVFPAGERSVDVLVNVNAENIAIGQEAYMELAIAQTARYEVESIEQVTDTIWDEADPEKYTIETSNDTTWKEILEPIASPSGKLASSVSITIDYTWVSAGSCLMTSTWVGNSDPIRIKIQKAKEGTGLYRLVSPYWVMEPDYCDEEIAPSRHLQFVIDEEDGTAISVPTFIPLGVFNSSGAEYQWYFVTTGSLAGYCSFTNEGNTYTLNTLRYTGGSLYATQGPEVWVWDEGYPFE
ncbi:MAG: hypothetical protein J6I32_07060 [Bacteroidaceae bacterium]|nr:hypothetical protein [Bacteroidaceae bacterium]